MKSIQLLIFIVVFILSSVTGSAQETRVIRGKVKPKRTYDCGNQELAWTNITVKVQSRGQVIEPDPQRSKNEDWSHPKVNVGSVVSIGFVFNCYRPREIPSYEITSADSQTLPTVDLYPVKKCSRCPSRPSHKTVLGMGGAQSVIGATTTDVEVPAPELVERKPSGEEVIATLKEDAAIFLKFDSLDVFQYNFEVLELAYAENAELASVLKGFKTSAENSTFFKGFGKERSKAFRNIIEKPLLGRGAFDPAEAIKLMSETSIDSSIRGSAVVALLDSNLDPFHTSKLLDQLRRNAGDKSSDLYLTSVIALARLGRNEDRIKIAQDVKSNDPDIAFAALSAVRVAQITDNTNPFGSSVPAIMEVAATSKDAGLRQAAILALRPSVYYYREERAVQTVTNALLRDESAEVRVEAAEALGLGRLELRQDIRNKLIQARQTDVSKAVRIAAENSLTGRAQ